MKRSRIVALVLAMSLMLGPVGCTMFDPGKAERDALLEQQQQLRSELQEKHMELDEWNASLESMQSDLSANVQSLMEAPPDMDASTRQLVESEVARLQSDIASARAAADQARQSITSIKQAQATNRTTLTDARIEQARANHDNFNGMVGGLMPLLGLALGVPALGAGRKA